MQKIFYLILLIIGLSSQTMGQTCANLPTCTTTVQINGSLSNTNLNGNKCFSTICGPGTISNSTSFNNWNWYRFKDTIQVSAPLNLSGGKKKFYIEQFSKVKANTINFDGNDTGFVMGSASLEIVQFTTNNSFTNVLVLATGASLKIGGNIVTAPDTVYGPGNGSNKLVIVACSYTALPVRIFYFIGRENVLSWKTEGYTTLQMSEDGVNFKSVYVGSEGIYEDKTFEFGKRYYRLYIKEGNEVVYSYVIVHTREMVVFPIFYYDMSGRILPTKPTQGYYLMKQGSRVTKHYVD